MVPLVVLFFQVVGVLLAMKLDSRIVFVVQRVLVAVLSVLRLLFESLVSIARKERKLHGPIIKEHLTNGTVAGGSTVVYDFNANGRERVRVFVKGVVDATIASGVIVFYLVPVYHLDEVSNTTWPNDSAGRPDYFVYPNSTSLGTVSFNSAGAFSGAIYTTGDAHSGGYRLIVQNATQNGGGSNLDVTQSYISTEVF